MTDAKTDPVKADTRLSSDAAFSIVNLAEALREAFWVPMANLSTEEATAEGALLDNRLVEAITLFTMTFVHAPIPEQDGRTAEERAEDLAMTTVPDLQEGKMAEYIAALEVKEAVLLTELPGWRAKHEEFAKLVAQGDSSLRLIAARLGPIRTALSATQPTLPAVLEGAPATGAAPKTRTRVEKDPTKMTADWRLPADGIAEIVKTLGIPAADVEAQMIAFRTKYIESGEVRTRWGVTFSAHMKSYVAEIKTKADAAAAPPAAPAASEAEPTS